MRKAILLSAVEPTRVLRRAGDLTCSEYLLALCEVIKCTPKGV